MRAARYGLIGILAALLGACRAAAPPLPPIPANSGGVMVRAGEAPPVRDGQAVIDRVVAVVNDEVIMMSELQEAVILYQREARGAPEGSDLERMVLNRLVDHRLQVQEARREKIEIGDDELRNVVDDFVRRNGNDRAKIETQLRAQGVTWEALRRELREQLLAQRVRSRKVVRRATVTENEVSAYLAENRERFESGLRYHARHIAITADPPSSPAAWDQAKRDADAIVAALAGGADFAELARARSKDPSAATGGDLGWLARGELDAAFEGPLLRLAPGQVTAPIRSSAGYHVFKLEEREEMTPERLAEARQQVRDLLLQKKAQERFDEWLEGLRRRALIAIRL
ncbi:MAG TPA: peptidylprolyl isomerase [Methylomirabilota bacterium]|jgi:peptidyl-prolyl cis-trans isomerase SurA|nr:peptidylprolyl isomerase [Methylomirabilota bacterium]